MRTAFPLRLALKLIASVWVIAFVSFVYGQSAEMPEWQTAAGGKLAFDVASIRQISPDAPCAGNLFEINAQDQFVPTGGLFALTHGSSCASSSPTRSPTLASTTPW
jgi:hypothetical protein